MKAGDGVVVEANLVGEGAGKTLSAKVTIPFDIDDSVTVWFLNPKTDTFVIHCKNIVVQINSAKVEGRRLDTHDYKIRRYFVLGGEKVYPCYMGEVEQSCWSTSRLSNKSRKSKKINK